LLDGDQLQVAIDQHHKHHWEPETYGGGHLPYHHQKAPVTCDTDHLTLRMTQLGGERCRDPKTHRRPAIGHDQMAWSRCSPCLPNQVGMGADIARQEAIGRQEFLNRSQDLRWRQRIAWCGERGKHALPARAESLEIPGMRYRW